MKKRLRKKFHLGEYQEFGFEIKVEFAGVLTDEQLDEFVNAFTDEALDKNDLDFEGGGDHSHFFGFLMLNRRGSVTEEQRANVETWLKEKAEIKSYTVGELVDAWYA